jgi:chromosomal replication initiator protein
VPATSSADILCARIAQRLADDIGPRRYAMWFDRSARLDYHEDSRRLELMVPNRFVADWIGKHFESNVRAAASHELGHDVELDLQVRSDLFSPAGILNADAASPSPAPATQEAQAAALTSSGTLQAARQAQRSNLRHSLDNFIVGPSNQLVYAAACRISEMDQPEATPLFIHGGCGLGKTHLLQGICRRVLDRDPNARVAYFTAEQFTNEFLSAVRANNVASFRNRIRKLDLLAVDDIHFIANKQATQQEFLHCFDAIDLGGARIVLASDSHPRLIKQFSEALISRCVRGMVVEVKQPDVVTRSRIIRAIASRRSIQLMDSVVEVIASKTGGSVREIEGTLTKLQALASLTARQGQTGEQGVMPGEIGHTLVNQLFAAEMSHAPRHAIRFETILEQVSEMMGVGKTDIVGSGRKQAVVMARSLVIHLTRQMTHMSYPEIAAAMGKASHSTMITADQRLVSQLSTDMKVVLPSTLEEVTLVDLVDRLKHAINKA